jgi:ATP-dependent DNA helicase RecG
MKEKELKLILEEGEGNRIEFKESLGGIDKEMIAFANTSGGKILIGVSDGGKIKGVKITNKLKSNIQDIANNCEPRVKIILEQFDNTLIVNVREGTDKPYRCKSGFYTRVGPNSQKMDREEIIDFFKVEGKIRYGELINPDFDYDKHFDERKLDKFLKLAGITKNIDTPSILNNLGVAEKQEGKILFNNAGILFFSKNLRDIYYHTTVTCALYKGLKKVNVIDRKDFNEDIISNIDNAMIFLKQHIPLRYEMTGEPRRKEIPEIPYDALREAIINAVTHRNYFEKGANVMVEMFDNRIEISNPGGLVKGLSLEDFGKKSVLRNPNIAGLLHRIGYIEKMGTGINKMRKLINAAELPPIKFEFTKFFTAVFSRPVSGKIQPDEEDIYKIIRLLRHEGLNEGVSEGVKIRLGKELVYFIKNHQMKRTEIEKLLEVSRATAERDISVLKDLSLITFEGPPKTGKYILTKKGKQLIGELSRE